MIGIRRAWWWRAKRTRLTLDSFCFSQNRTIRPSPHATELPRTLYVCKIQFASTKASSSSAVRATPPEKTWQAGTAKPFGVALRWQQCPLVINRPSRRAAPPGHEASRALPRSKLVHLVQAVAELLQARFVGHEAVDVPRAGEPVVHLREYVLAHSYRRDYPWGLQLYPPRLGTSATPPREYRIGAAEQIGRGREQQGHG